MYVGMVLPREVGRRKYQHLPFTLSLSQLFSIERERERKRKKTKHTFKYCKKLGDMTSLVAMKNQNGGQDERKGIKLPSDSMIVYIPIDVTADLGVAMKRVRARRIAKYKQLLSIPLGESYSNMDGEIPKASNQNTDSPDDVKQKTDLDGSNLDTIGSEVRRDQFSSMVDYLEAKYARGIMIHDLDERIRRKKKQSGGGDDLSVLSDSEAGSCYSEDSDNFIDDSDLRTDIAHQILASSAFGTTKVEAEAARAKRVDDESIDADDHAFFVNVGDLEMEDGWNHYDLEEDQDWMNSMKRSKGYVIICHHRHGKK
jgi:hypothetical protein